MDSKKRAVIVVKVLRKFEYPKSMLNRNDYKNDAMMKARNDMQTIVNEIVNNDHHEIDINIFELEVSEERGYKFRKPELEQDDRAADIINISKAAKALSTHKIEEIHGQLNPEINPQLYDREPALLDERGRIIREETWYMRQDIENEMYNSYEVFRNILRAAQK